MVAQQIDRLEEIISRFKGMGYRITPQRMAIVQIMINDTGHPTVEQVYEKVKLDFPMTSRATVYKTIGLLKDMGEISELNFSTGGSHFDGFATEMHPHLVCTSCGEIVDLHNDLVTGKPGETARSHGYVYQGYKFTIFGICPNCQK